MHWLYHEAGRYFHEQWARFRDGVPAGERDGNLILAYDRLLNEHPDPIVRARAALDLGGPADVPWLLSRAWPGSELHLVGTGHRGGEEMTVHMRAALDRFART